MENLKTIDLENNLTLEPRLHEYLKKINYYKKNNITPIGNLEKEYAITIEDRAFLKTLAKNKVIDNVPVIKTNVKFELDNFEEGFKIKHDDFKKDPRFAKLQQKIQRDVDANNSRYSYATTNFTTDEQYRVNQESTHFLDSRYQQQNHYIQRNSNININNINTPYTNYPANIQYNQYLPHKQFNNSMNDLPHNNNLDSMQYFSSRQQYNINDAKITKNDRDKRNMKNLYNKYPNYDEHFFSYISNDIQHPNHTVLPFSRGGNMARLENNYKQARPFQYNDRF